MVKVSKGQRYFDFVTDLSHRLEIGVNPPSWHLPGLSQRADEHVMGALMVVACLANLEAHLGPHAWRNLGVSVDEVLVMLTRHEQDGEQQL